MVETSCAKLSKLCSGKQQKVGARLNLTLVQSELRVHTGLSSATRRQHSAGRVSPADRKHVDASRVWPEWWPHDPQVGPHTLTGTPTGPCRPNVAPKSARWATTARSQLEAQLETVRRPIGRSEKLRPKQSGPERPMQRWRACQAAGACQADPASSARLGEE